MSVVRSPKQAEALWEAYEQGLDKQAPLEASPQVIVETQSAAMVSDQNETQSTTWPN